MIVDKYRPRANSFRPTLRFSEASGVMGTLNARKRNSIECQFGMECREIEGNRKYTSRISDVHAVSSQTEPISSIRDVLSATSLFYKVHYHFQMSRTIYSRDL